MQTIVVTPLLIIIMIGGSAAGSAAQSSQTATAPAPETDVAAGLEPEPQALTRAVDFASHWLGGDGSSARDGFYPDFSDMVTGAGWISGGPGYRRHFLDRHLFVDGSAAISWRAYKEAQARIELTDLARNHATLGFEVQWQDLTQVNYFGIGANSLESQRSEYRLRNTDVAGYGIIRANGWLSFGGRFGWVKQPTISSSVGPFDRDFPDARLEFPAAPGMAAQTSLLHGGATVEADTRDHPSRPTRGGLYRAAAQAYSDRDLHQFSFRRYEAEGLQIVPIVGERWVIALHAWGVFSDTSAANSVPFYMLPSLGGGNTLRGYHDYRFHDRHLLVVNGESRWALFSHVDAAAFVDAGNVAARVGDLNLAKISYGGGLRVHTRTSTLVRLDVAHSREGWRVLFRLSDPFRLARRSLRTPVIPFVP
jgi:outer membrane protein assembly factor BamA